MTDYRVRVATIADADVLVHHRVAMFEDMGLIFDRARLESAFRPWLLDRMDAGTYKAWVVEADHRTIAGGGAINVIPWPPGPRYFGDRLAFVYNVYIEPAHRRRGLAKQLMVAIHDWCRAEGITSLALNASRFGRPLYEDLGYAVTESPMMFKALGQPLDMPKV